MLPDIIMQGPEEMKLKNEIHAIAIDFPRFGYRRITIELHRRGFETNHKVVYELMKGDNLLCIKKQFVQEFIYLAVIIDVFSRKCIGWKLGRDIDAELTLATLDNAFAESFFKTLKYEEVYLWEYETYSEAHKNIKKFLEIVYNKKRVHSSIGYITLEEFEILEEVLSRNVS
jgi:putative transposase